MAWRRRSRGPRLYRIACDALKAPMPLGWKLYEWNEGSGEPFYFSYKTGESVWDHLLDHHFKNLYTTEKRKKQDGAARPLTAIGRHGGTLQGARE
jgi:centrosomal protein CEP164